ncbi:hypothetical protein, partial [Nocardia cyriacigeorgica]|uniref:hypothetical protein n=1 Tax=Nocardia cyriacigeorgica TaxID=135487 RepID=UPI0024554686
MAALWFRGMRLSCWWSTKWTVGGGGTPPRPGGGGGGGGGGRTGEAERAERGQERTVAPGERGAPQPRHP